MPVNPYELLRLDPSASEEEAVGQAARLCQRAADEPARNAVRQAIQQLTASADDRALHALLTHPRPDHSAAEIDRLVAAFRRPPAATDDGLLPGLDMEEFRSLFLQALSEELAVPREPLEPVAAAESEAEITRQTAEALWQGVILSPEL